MNQFQPMKLLDLDFYGKFSFRRNSPVSHLMFLPSVIKSKFGEVLKQASLETEAFQN